VDAAFMLLQRHGCGIHVVSAEPDWLATQDDASVAGGFLAVTVRPWRVMMQGGVPGGTRA
jgi:hypothetical protein